jgi:3-dehydroquinate synthase
VDTLTVALGARSYPLHIGPGVLRDAALYPAAAKQILVVSNEVVAPLYLDAVRAALGDREVETLILPDGERAKTLATFAGVVDRLVDARFHRDCCLLALGGGVVGDVTGYAAASFQRGVDFVQVPTTLLAQVDSSVGGKTAVNHPLGKNMVGAFWQPQAVLIDTRCLATLPDREYRSGLAEVVKYGAIHDAGFFAWLEANADALRERDDAALVEAIHVSCRIKAEIVARDERETGERAFLNYGHTFGHAIETGTGYGEWMHGEAVAAGMVLAARLSARINALPERDVARIAALLQRLAIRTDAPRMDFAKWMALMRRDKKVEGAAIRFVLLEALGRAQLRGDVPDDALRELLT